MLQLMVFTSNYININRKLSFGPFKLEKLYFQPLRYNCSISVNACNDTLTDVIIITYLIYYDIICILTSTIVRFEKYGVVIRFFVDWWLLGAFQMFVDFYARRPFLCLVQLLLSACLGWFSVYRWFVVYIFSVLLVLNINCRYYTLILLT